MGFIAAVRSIDPAKVFYAIILFIPYVDTETLGATPLLREIVPFVEPIYWLELDWSERTRLVIFILVPILDGELFELLGVDPETVYRD